MTITKEQRKRIYKAVEPAYYEGFMGQLNALRGNMYEIARDLLEVAEQEPWRPWSEILEEILHY